MWFGSHCSERGGGGLCGKDVVAKRTASWSLRCEVSDMPPSTTERGMDVSGGCGAHTFVLGGITAILERIAPPPPPTWAQCPRLLRGALQCPWESCFSISVSGRRLDCATPPLRSGVDPRVLHPDLVRPSPSMGRESCTACGKMCCEICIGRCAGAGCVCQASKLDLFLGIQVMLPRACRGRPIVQHMHVSAEGVLGLTT